MIRNCILVTLLILFSSLLCYAAPLYAITDVGTLPGNWSMASAINNRGQVVGVSDVWREAPYFGPERHAFLWQKGVMRDLGTLPSPDPYDRYSYAFHINNRGQVVGWSSRRAFVWDKGITIDLGSLGGSLSSASAINDVGQIVGYSFLAGGVSVHAFLWQHGTMSDLETFGGPNSIAADINNRGQIVGGAQTTQPDALGSYIDHAFIWENGIMKDLGTLQSYSGSGAHSINNQSQIVGASYRWITDTITGKLEWDIRGVLWQDGEIVDLGTLPDGKWSIATDINERGQIIGFAHTIKPTFPNPIRAVTWINGVVYDLNDLIPLDSGWMLSRADGINDLGQIVGEGYLLGRGIRGFLLTPISGPSGFGR